MVRSVGGFEEENPVRFGIGDRKGVRAAFEDKEEGR
jgi:hypothetical protein